MRSKRYLFLAALACLALLIAPDVLAQNYGLDGAAGKSIPKTTDIAAIIGRILKTLLGFVGTLFLLLMVYAGFLWMTARGDAKKVDQAKQLIVSAIIGVIIIAGAYAITSFVLKAATGTGQAETTGTPKPKGAEGALCDGVGGGLDCESGVCSAQQTGTCSDDPSATCADATDCATQGATCTGGSPYKCL